MELYTVNDGLPQHDVSSIVQDKYGYVWMTTYDGLVRYDGYEFLKYRYNPDDDKSIRDNRAICLLKDSYGHLWVGTEGGSLNKYNYDADSFFSIKLSENSMDMNIHSLFEDSNNKIWVGTIGGLFILNPDTQDITQILSGKTGIGAIYSIHVTFDSKIFIGTSNGLYQIVYDKKSHATCKRIANQSIYSIKEVNDYCLLIGSSNGLYKLDHIENSYEKINFENTDLLKIRSIVKLNDSRFLIGTENQGIYELKSGDKYSVEPINIEYDNILRNACIKDLYIDSFRNIWIGTGNIGVARINLSAPKFQRHFDDPISNNFVKTFLKDSKGRMWVQSKKEALFVLKNKSKLSAQNKAENIVNSLLEDKNGNIWASTSDNIFILQASDNETEILSEKNKLIFPDHIRKNLSSVKDIKEDRFGNIWIGAKSGLIVVRNYGKKNMSYKLHTEFNIQRKNINITRLLPESKSNRLWICSYDLGVIVAEINQEGDITVQSRFYNSENKNNKLNSNHVWAISQSRNGDIWLGTDAGLNRIVFDNKNYKVKELKGSGELKNEKIISIVEDNNDNLWLATSEGLITLKPQSGKVIRYYYQDGLSSNSFAEAGMIDKKGIIYFATINGITSFDPKQIKPNALAPKILFSELSIFNKIIRVNDKSDQHILLDKAINESELIQLSHKENNFAIKFTGIHFQKPEKNKFAYKLEGYDNNWIYKTAINRTASYNNLKPGKYKLLIKSSNSDNVWSDIKQINVVILAAPWATWWAYSLYIIAILFILWYIYTYKKRQSGLKHQLEIEKVHHEHQRNLQEARLRFHSNLTHEIRTPLTLISAPLIEVLNSCTDDYVNSRLNLIKKNTERLLTLVNQFLDIHKIDKECMPLCITKCNIHLYINHIYNSFNPLFQQKNISFSLSEKFEKNSKVWIDEDKITKITSNLLSNASKFTSKNGIVELDVSLISNHLIISVSDNGIGINDADKELIFDRFYQAEPNKRQGTGIGLTLVKELVTLHKGSIHVKDNMNKGCCFIVKIPVSKEMYSDKDIIENDKTIVNLIAESSQENEYDNKHIVLVIEDDIDMNNYITSILCPHFDVIAADNAEEGLAMAIEKVPNVILTDISLPGMDGLELCRKLKNNDHTSHIPVIMLTARIDDFDITKGYESGAEMYLTKPFNPDLLKVQIRNIVLYRNKNKENVLYPNSKSDVSQEHQNGLQLNEREQSFLNKINQILDERMEDTEFSIEELCKEIGTSRMQLHRKLTAIIGQSTSEYIRNYKMNKAMELLETGNYNVSEVIYQVGFKSHSHFTKVFKDTFNIAPSDYLKKNQ